MKRLYQELGLKSLGQMQISKIYLFFKYFFRNISLSNWDQIMLLITKLKLQIKTT